MFLNRPQVVPYDCPNASSAPTSYWLSPSASTASGCACMTRSDVAFSWQFLASPSPAWKNGESGSQAMSPPAMTVSGRSALPPAAVTREPAGGSHRRRDTSARAMAIRFITCFLSPLPGWNGHAIALPAVVVDFGAGAGVRDRLIPVRGARDDAVVAYRAGEIVA